eukprot:2756139-Amphidinium_carterae.1
MQDTLLGKLPSLDVLQAVSAACMHGPIESSSSCAVEKPQQKASSEEVLTWFSYLGMGQVLELWGGRTEAGGDQTRSRAEGLEAGVRRELPCLSST